MPRRALERTENPNRYPDDIRPARDNDAGATSRPDTGLELPEPQDRGGPLQRGGFDIDAFLGREGVHELLKTHQFNDDWFFG